MYGWRARIGLIVADSNTVLEPEFSSVTPDGISVHAARVRVGGVYREGVAGTLGSVERAVGLLSHIRANVFAYGCTAANMSEGEDGDFAQAQRINELTGRPAVTAASALVEAVSAMKFKRIAVVTPYPSDLNESTEAFWDACGVEVAFIGGADLGGPRAPLKPLSSRPVSHVGLQFPAAAYNLVRNADLRNAEAVVVSGANLRSIEMIELVERDFKIPCISSTSALIWACLQAAGICDPMLGLGQLLKDQPQLQWKRIPGRTG